MNTFLNMAMVALLGTAEPMDNPVERCALWLDAKNNTSVVLDENSCVVEWKDLSGNERHIRQSVTSHRPAYKDGALVFSGNEWLAAESDNAEVKEFSVFAVFETEDEHPLRLMSLCGNGGFHFGNKGLALGLNDSDIIRLNNSAAFLMNDENGASFDFGVRGDARALGVNRIIPPQYPSLLGLGVGYSSGTNSVRKAEVFLHGKQIGTNLPLISSESGIPLFSEISIGSADKNGVHPFAGRIMALLIYDRKLDQHERERVDKWLTERYGLTPPPPVILDARARSSTLTPRAQAVLSDGALLYVSNDTLYESTDGKEWETRFSKMTRDPGLPDIALSGGLLAETPQGTLILITCDKRPEAYVKLTAVNGVFNNTEAKSHIYAFRSDDRGKSWRDGKLIQTEYCGALRDIKVTQAGGVVVSLQAWDPDTERHITKVHVSKDDGLTFRSCSVDNGIGRGLHDGFYESTIAEMTDGSLLMFARTVLGVLWESRSFDGGISWSAPQATDIEASSYPAFLLRLKSGRLVVAWNRYYPDGYSGRDDLINIAPKSWYWGLSSTSRFNRELSVMFSSDNGETWSHSVVIAAGRQDFSALAYPTMLERKPGEIFLWAGSVSLIFNENDFYPATGASMKKNADNMGTK